MNYDIIDSDYDISITMTGNIMCDIMPPVSERLRRAYPALLERAGVGSIPANSDAQNVPSFRRWQFEMKHWSLVPFWYHVYDFTYDIIV
jgi:hypothetical protein